MSAPRLELVERFEDLRVSDVVVLKGCGRCDGIHRVMLVREYREVPVVRPSGGIVVTNAFGAIPTPPCIPVTEEYVINEMAVTLKKVYREVIPPAAEAEKATAQCPKQRVRESAGRKDAMTTARERRALLAYAREWGRGRALTALAIDGLKLMNDDRSGLDYLEAHGIVDGQIFPHIAESLAYDGESAGRGCR